MVLVKFLHIIATQIQDNIFFLFYCIPLPEIIDFSRPDP
jgi:hypothetical protein